MAEPAKPTTPAKNTTPAAPAVKGQAKDKVKDTRAPNVIWAERAEATRLIMQRQFGKLIQLGNARNAAPSPDQEAAFRKWYGEQTDAMLDALFGHLHQSAAQGPLLTSPGVTPGFRPKTK